MVQSAEEKRAKQKEYYQKNKERLLAYRKERYEKNKERHLVENKEYYQKNKERLLAEKKVYNEQNKERNAATKKAYRQTEHGKKMGRIDRWKQLGVICDDWDELHEKYKNTTHCEECGVELTEDKKMTPTTRCLDHNHETGLFRNVLCHSCNVRRG